MEKCINCGITRGDGAKLIWDDNKGLICEDCLSAQKEEEYDAEAQTLAIKAKHGIGRFE